MYRSLLGDSRLYELLRRCYEDLAATGRAQGCTCGGALHRASYARKPRGFIAGQPAGYDERHSFCCAQDGCRKRTTPSSLRFLGPKVYLGAVVTLVTALRCGLNERRVSELEQLVGASRRTLERWRLWWQELLPATPFFRVVRAWDLRSVSRAATSVTARGFQGSSRLRPRTHGRLGTACGRRNTFKPCRAAYRLPSSQRGFSAAVPRSQQQRPRLRFRRATRMELATPTMPGSRRSRPQGVRLAAR